MATVIGVEGSTYRREGAKMLFDEKGFTYGMISGGCLEEDLIHHAMEVLQSGTTKIVTYDLKSENETSWGAGFGCNGIVYVFVEEVGWNGLKDRNGKNLWEIIDQKLLSGYRVASLKVIDEENDSNNKIYYSEDGEVLYYSSNLKQQLIKHLKTFILLEEKVELTEENQGKIMMELYKPREPLYIFGAGPDVEPLVKLVSKLDFSVCLIDARSKRCNKENFPTADELVIEFPHLYLRQKDLPLNSFVLIMTHNFKWDQYVLRHLVKKPPQYIGVLGPRRRTERLLYPELIPDWVHSPVGVDIFSEGPEEIAISIAAELIKRRNRNKKEKYPSL